MAITPPADRRDGARRRNTPDGILGVRLRPGRTTALVDVSDSGVGLVTDTRVAPGTSVDVVLVGSSALRIRRGVVVHARVCALHPTDGARFRVGVRLTPDWAAGPGTPHVNG